MIYSEIIYEVAHTLSLLVAIVFPTEGSSKKAVAELAAGRKPRTCFCCTMLPSEKMP